MPFPLTNKAWEDIGISLLLLIWVLLCSSLQGIGLRQPSGALGVSPVVSVARGLLLSHPDAVAGHTAWDASEVERLQATYPVMMSACGAVMAAGGIPNLGE
jgi:hypothetical protein